MDDNQAAGVLDSVPLEEDVGSARRRELLVGQPAVVRRMEHFSGWGGRNPPAEQRAGGDHGVREHFEVRATLGETGGP